MESASNGISVFDSAHRRGPANAALLRALMVNDGTETAAWVPLSGIPALR